MWNTVNKKQFNLINQARWNFYLIDINDDIAMENDAYLMCDLTCSYIHIS